MASRTPLLLFLFASQFGLVSAFAQEENPEAAARAIVEGETKFFETGQEQGTRAAFLSFLADDSIVFQPGPVDGKKTWSGRPDSGPSLKWQPAFAAMSGSCDLGFTTGPSEWRKNKEDEKASGYGFYISIWKKQKDGPWKVALDVGGEAPSAQKIEGPPGMLAGTAKPPLAPEAAAAATKKLREAEKWFVTTAKTDSTAALIGSSSENLRVYREGVFPAIGRTPAGLMLSVRRGNLSVERMGGGMSGAGDLAYSYGKYTLVRPENTERGHYLQIWHADVTGDWKVLLDFQTPLPPAEKKPTA